MRKSYEMILYRVASFTHTGIIEHKYLHYVQDEERSINAE
jgi:hypothetical protein